MYNFRVLHCKFDRYEPLESNQHQMKARNIRKCGHNNDINLFKCFTATEAKYK